MKLGLTVLAFALGVAGTVSAQQDMSQVEIQTLKVADNIHMLVGSGGNIGAVVGSDGTFIVDDQYAPLTDRIMAALRTISEQPVRFVLNTHWHFDHTGGNENMGKTGAVIVAHENVRKRMSVGQFMTAFNMQVDPAPAIALPVVTFAEDVSFHLNGEKIAVSHVPHAHTDGDAIVAFQNSNVIHMGDCYWNGMYPFVDVESGGSIDGMINAVGNALKMMDDNTKVIPGHGALSNRAELQSFHEMLVHPGRIEIIQQN